MDLISPPQQPNVKVALPSRQGLDPELGRAIVSSLDELGYNSTVCYDGDPLDCDVLLLVRDVTLFPEYASSLSRQSDRPRTLLWQMEAFPPADLSPELEASGLRRTSITSQLRLPPALRRVIPSTIRHRAWTALVKTIFPRRLRGGWPKRYDSLDPVSKERSLSKLAWIRKHPLEGWVDNIFVSAPNSVEFLAARGIQSMLIPVGWHEVLATDLVVSRDIDVAFIGNSGGRDRGKIVKKIRTAMRREGYSFVEVQRDCYGRDRHELLSRAKITLNLTMFPWHLSGIRFVLSMGCGSLVVSEQTERWQPFVPEVNFVQAELPSIVETLVGFLKDEGARQRLAAEGKRFVTRQHTLLNGLRSILALSEETARTIPQRTR